jgi:hypothetical protein
MHWPSGHSVADVPAQHEGGFLGSLLCPVQNQAEPPVHNLAPEKSHQQHIGPSLYERSNKEYAKLPSGLCVHNNINFLSVLMVFIYWEEMP